MALLVVFYVGTIGKANQMSSTNEKICTQV